MAARLDGELNDEEQARFDRDLATDGRDMQELVAAAELPDAVSTHRAAVPADLLALHRPPAPVGGSDPVMAAPDRPSGELPRMAPTGNQDMVPLPRKR